MASVEPKVPRAIDPLGREILEQLRDDARAQELILGGGLALAHYAEFRETHDIDAWWRTGATTSGRTALAEAVRTVAERHGLGFRERAWGETISYEIIDPAGQRAIFAFQVAPRDVQLDEAGPSSWPPLLLESLRDNVGSKMNALVDRGAPRDFVDIYEIVKRGLATPAECWELWQRKNAGATVKAARDKVLHNLLAIEARTPLESLDASQRDAAAARRDFFRRGFIDGH